MDSPISTKVSEIEVASDDLMSDTTIVATTTKDDQCVTSMSQNILYLLERSYVLRGLIIAGAVIVAVMLPIVQQILLSLSFSAALHITLFLAGISLFCYDVTNYLNANKFLRKLSQKFVDEFVLDDTLKTMFDYGGEFLGASFSLMTVTPIIYSLPLTSHHRVQLVQAAMEMTEKEAKSLLLSPGGIKWLLPQSTLDWLYYQDEKEKEVALDNENAVCDNSAATVSVHAESSPTISSSSGSSSCSSESSSKSGNGSSSSSGKNGGKASNNVPIRKTAELKPTEATASRAFPQSSPPSDTVETSQIIESALTIDDEGNQKKRRRNDEDDDLNAQVVAPSHATALTDSIIMEQKVQQQTPPSLTIPTALKSILCDLVADQFGVKNGNTYSSIMDINGTTNMLNFFSNNDEADIPMKTVGILSLLSSLLQIRYSSMPTRKLFLTIVEVSSILSLIAISSGTLGFLLLKYYLREQQQQQQQQKHHHYQHKQQEEEEEEDQQSTQVDQIQRKAEWRDVANLNTLAPGIKAFWIVLFQRLKNAEFRRRWGGLVAALVILTFAKIRNRR